MDCTILNSHYELLYKTSKERANWYVERYLGEIVVKDPMTMILLFDPCWNYIRHGDNKERRVIKEVLYYRGQGICFYCGDNINFNDSTVDHVIPRSKYGSNGLENLVISCELCNLFKRDNVVFMKEEDVVAVPLKNGKWKLVQI